MKREVLQRSLFVLFALVITLPACGVADGATVGDEAPSFTLPDLEGESHSLADYRGKVVVLEWINPNCPFSLRHAEEETMIGIDEENPDIAFLAINSTAESSGDYLTPQEHLEYNREQGIDYPVLYDTDGTVGQSYGAKTTPHMIVIDEQGEIIYDGAIDDDPYGKKDDETNYVEAALATHETGESPDPATTKPYGCSVKYGG